jgi:hypothetical protein
VGKNNAILYTSGLILARNSGSVPIEGPEMAKKTVMLDKYARDARAWRDFATHNYAASTYLFESHNPYLIFNAATLGHHALEMYLKAALICEGGTVFDPQKLKQLPSSVRPQIADCAWGHDLVVLARQLAVKRTDFDLGEQMDILVPWHVSGGVVTVEQGFQIFNPFFSELRYPQELTMGGVGEDDKLPLDELVDRLQPFLAKIK